MNLLLLVKFALRDIRYDWRRSLLSFGKLSFMVITYLMTAVLAQAFEAFSFGAVTSAQNLVIVSKDILDPMDSNLDPALVPQAAQAIQDQFGPETVRMYVPVYFSELNVGERMLQVFAAPREAFENIFQLELQKGRWPADTNEAAISTSVARNAGWEPGTSLKIFGQPFVLVGIVETNSRGSASVWITAEAGQRVFSPKRGVQFGVIQLHPQADLHAIQAWLEENPLLEKRYAVYQESQLNETFDRAMKGIQPLGAVFQGLALLVVTFGAFNVASLTLQERDIEINILRQVNFPETTIQGFVVVRGILICLLAYFAGWAATWLIQVPYQGGAIIYGAYLHLSLTPQVTWAGLFLALASSIVGAWLATLSIRGKA